MTAFQSVTRQIQNIYTAEC